MQKKGEGERSKVPVMGSLFFPWHRMEWMDTAKRGKKMIMRGEMRVDRSGGRGKADTDRNTGAHTLSRKRTRGDVKGSRSTVSHRELMPGRAPLPRHREVAGRCPLLKALPTTHVRDKQ